MSLKRALFVTTVPITLTSFLLPLASMLRENGWHIDCLSSDSPSPNAPPTSADPELRRAFDARYDIGWNRSPLSALAYASLARRVRTLVHDGEYDVVHVHTPIAAFVTRAALRNARSSAEKRVRLIYTVHGFHFHSGSKGSPSAGAYRAAEWLAAPWTDDLVVMNSEDEDAAHKLCAPRRKGDAACRVHRIDGTGMNFDAFDRHSAEASGLNEDTRRRLGIAATDFVVTLIGEMNANKRQALAIEAIALLTVDMPDVSLLLVGDGSLRADLERLVVERRVESRVTFTGQVPTEAVKSLAYVTQVGLLVSKREGLPRSLMELVAGGATIAGTRTRGIVDEVLDERAIASTADAKGVAEVIRRLHNDASLREEIRATQFEHARERFSLEKTLGEYWRLYDA